MPSLRAGKIGPLLVATAVQLAPDLARADEAFLCGPSTVVYVKAEDVEARKKTDPCVAAYFGLTVTPAPAPNPAPAPAVAEPAPPGANPSVVRTIARPKADAAASRARPTLKTLEAPETSESVAAASPSPTAFLTPPVPPSPAPDTDFRNVRIINAEPGGEQWFRHVK